jgi:AcrR family transcriptional regulator
VVSHPVINRSGDRCPASRLGESCTLLKKRALRLSRPWYRVSEDEVELEAHDDMLPQAARLFRAKGFTGTTPTEIAQLLGIRRPSVYYYQAKKEDLLYMVCQAAMENAYAAAVKALAEKSTAFTRLRLLIKGHMETVLPEVDCHVVMLTETKWLSKPRRDDIQAMRDEYERLVSALIHSAQTEGELRKDIPTKHLTLGLFNLLHWPLFWYRPEGELDPAGVGELVATIFLQGAGSRT